MNPPQVYIPFRMLPLNVPTISFHDQLDRKEILNIFPFLIKAIKEFYWKC